MNKYQVLLIDNSTKIIKANTATEAVNRVNHAHYQIQVVKAVAPYTSYTGV